jgi:hypothetical protein
MAHDVFISHSAKDKVTGDAVCAMLESNGIRCWIAPRDVTPGMEWGECIVDAIKRSRVMVLVFSAHANESPQIRKEIERAVNHGVAILPLRIEDVQPGLALEYFIGNVHWLDALTPPFENHLRNLADTVKVLLERMGPVKEGPVLGSPAAPAPAKKDPISAAAPTVAPPRTVFPEAAAETIKPAPRRRWLRMSLIGAAVVIVALLVLAFFFPRGSQRIVQNPSRLELALVADFSPSRSRVPLLNYDGSAKVYGIERDLTSPGDIESVAATKDLNGRPALEIRLTDAAVKRLNSGASIVDHDMALVLDDRTILTSARVQSALGTAIMMTGNFSSDEINRLLDAISAAAPGNK